MKMTITREQFIEDGLKVSDIGWDDLGAIFDYYEKRDRGETDYDIKRLLYPINHLDEADIAQSELFLFYGHDFQDRDNPTKEDKEYIREKLSRVTEVIPGADEDDYFYLDF
jgi:hypothetical protein